MMNTTHPTASRLSARTLNPALALCMALVTCGDEVERAADLQPACESGSEPGVPPGVTLRPAMRGATTLELAGDNDISTFTGENPTTATWDGKVIVRQCPDPEGTEIFEQPDEDEPPVLARQYFCFHAFRPGRVTLDTDGVPDFGDAFDAGFMSTTRHKSHSGGFPVVENLSPNARWNPYASTVDGVACGVASLEESPPGCPTTPYATYDVYLVHSVAPNIPTIDTDYPGWPDDGPGIATYFEQILIVVEDPETDAATVVDVIRDSTPYPIVADPNGFGFIYDADDPTTRNPYLFRRESDPDGPTYIGGQVTIEPGATNDGRMIIYNGGDESPNGPNLIYTWNPNPAAATGWSPPKNLAYMYYVEGPGSPTGETQIAIDGVPHAFSDVFPIARQPLRDQDGVFYNPGTTYVPATYVGIEGEAAYQFDTTVAAQHYIGAYPWISWDGRNVMSLAIGRFNVAVIGDLTGYTQYWIDGPIDRTDFHGDEAHQITAMWNWGQWPGRWAQFGVEFEGIERTIPTRLRDAVTWAIFEQDHYSEISFHKTDGSYARYFPMSRMRDRTLLYRADATPDVSGGFNHGALVRAGGQVDFSQSFSEEGFVDSALSRVFGFSGQSVGFLTDAGDEGVEPHIASEPVGEAEIALTVEGAIFLQTGPTLADDPWATIVRQPGAFALGVDAQQRPWFEVIDTGGVATRIAGEEAVPAGVWTHLTGVFDGGEIRLYVDARLVATAPATGMPLASSSDSLFVGPKNDDGEPGGNGLVFIDEVGISPTVRSFEEIAHSAFQRVVWPTATLAQWESVWGTDSMPLGLVDGAGALLAPLHIGYQLVGDLDAKIRLGERLFHDVALSTTTAPISCQSCHTLTVEHGGARRGEVTSTRGAGALTRHTPTVFNRVFGRRQFWDGRVDSLGSQVLFPITSPVEMNMSLEELTSTVLPAADYGDDYCAAFGRADTTVDGLQEALALYESGLVSGDSAVDRHRLLGRPLSASAERGLALFATKARCIGCHAPPLYTDERFHDNAQGSETDPGRAFLTTRPRDFGRFRTMSLRDVGRTPPYMHDGSVPTLQRVVELYNEGGDDLGELDVRPLGLTDDEIADLVSFLEALGSEHQVVGLGQPD